MKRHFAGARPCGVPQSSDESSESEEDEKIDKPKRFDSSAARIPVPGRVRRRPRVEAKVIISNGDEEEKERKPPRKGRKRIAPKVISGGSEDVKSEKKPDSETKSSPEDVPKPSPEKSQTKDLPSFVPVSKKNASLEEDVLPELRVEENADSGSGSESEEYSTSGSESEASNDVSGERVEQDYEEEETPAAPLAPVYIPQVVRADDERAAEEVRDKRKIEAYKRKREACNQVIRAAKHEVEETESDLKHVDMEKFPDDTDRPEDFDEEFAQWRVRELKRVMRDRGISVDDDDDQNEEEDEESVEKPNPSVESEAGERTFKVGAFFAEKNADGSYVQPIYNRDFRGQDEPESVKRTMLARGVRK